MSTPKGYRISKRARPGFTLIELLIASSLLLILALGIYAVFETSRVNAARSNAQTDNQQNARIALALMERELRMAGTGVPQISCPGTPTRIVDASRQSLTIRADLRGVFTTLTSAANTGTATLSVTGATEVGVGDVLYVTDGQGCETASVQAVATGSLTLASNLAQSYAAGSRVYRPKDVTFSISGGQFRRDERNPGAAASGSPPVLAEALLTQDTFRYFDNSGTEITSNNPVASPDSTVRLIRITLSAVSTPTGLRQETFTLQSDVQPRNL